MTASEGVDLGRVAKRKCICRCDQSVLNRKWDRLIERTPDEDTRNFASPVLGNACRGRRGSCRIVRRQHVENGWKLFGRDVVVERIRGQSLVRRIG